MPEEGHSQAGQPGQTPGGGWVPIPDPTTLTDAAISRATEVFRREIVALRETIETRLTAADQDRQRLWERLRDLPVLYETASQHIRDELIQRDAHDREVITQRLNDLDTASRIAAEHIEKIPVDLTHDVHKALRAEREYVMSQIQIARAETNRVGDVAQEKFAAIDGTFASNDKALTAALAAQEKAAAEQQKSNTLAIDKSEKNTQEQSKANQAQTLASIESQTATIADLKERIVRIEATGAGATAHRTEAREVRSDQRLSQNAILSVIVAFVIATGVIISLITLLHH
jgi:hypothetical protein